MTHHKLLCGIDFEDSCSLCQLEFLESDRHQEIPTTALMDMLDLPELTETNKARINAVLRDRGSN